MIDVQEFTARYGRSPFQSWVEDPDARAAVHVLLALSHTERRDVCNVKGMGGGTLELETGYGPGYRVYFGNGGGHVVIPLGGGTQTRQNRQCAYGQAACIF
jgi:putative addiction module killer protein